LVKIRQPTIRKTVLIRVELDNSLNAIRARWLLSGKKISYISTLNYLASLGVNIIDFQERLTKEQRDKLCTFILNSNETGYEGRHKAWLEHFIRDHMQTLNKKITSADNI
jgi:hypothetical protein